jgi:hypothetical protein
VEYCGRLACPAEGARVRHEATVKIHIDLDLTPGVKRALSVAAAGSVLLFGGAVAYAQTTGTSSDTLIGSALNTLGTAVAVLQAQVASLQALDHVARATISTTGGVMTQNGKWVGRVDHPAPGDYVLTFTPGVFSAPPSCVATPLAHEMNDPATLGGPLLSVSMLGCSAATLSSITCQVRDDRRGPQDTGLTMICVGP